MTQDLDNPERPIPNRANWYVVATRPRMELTARNNLERQGYTVWLPELTLKKRRKGKWTSVVEPMFPGYVFTQLVFGEEDPAPIRSTLGCRGLVRFGVEYPPQTTYPPPQTLFCFSLRVVIVFVCLYL